MRLHVELRTRFEAAVHLQMRLVKIRSFLPVIRHVAGASSEILRSHVLLVETRFLVGDVLHYLFFEALETLESSFIQTLLELRLFENYWDVFLQGNSGSRIVCKSIVASDDVLEQPRRRLV